MDIDLSVAGLGYSSVGTSRIGFFAEKCGVTDSATGSQKFYLVGSGDDSIGDNCLLPRSSVDITQKMNYENEQFWSKTQLDLEFDVFRFPGTGSLRAFCQLKMCLDDECPQDATPTC